MLNMELARKYARAIFELACEDHALKEYGADLAKVQQLYHDCPELKAYLCNPNIQPEDKKSLLKEVFEGGVRETVLNFLLLLVDKRRMMVFDAIHAIFGQLSNEKLGIAVADVTTVDALAPAQLQELTHHGQAGIPARAPRSLAHRRRGGAHRRPPHRRQHQGTSRSNDGTANGELAG